MGGHEERIQVAKVDNGGRSEKIRAIEIWAGVIVRGSSVILEVEKTHDEENFRYA